MCFIKSGWKRNGMEIIDCFALRLFAKMAPHSAAIIGGNFGLDDEHNYVEGESFFDRFFRRWGCEFRFDP